MKNREKYRDEILEWAIAPGRDICDFKRKEVLAHFGKGCGGISCSWCSIMLNLWLDEEYIEPAKPEAPLTDEQKTFLDGMKQTEIVLDSYFDMIIDTWSECSEEYQRSAKIIKNGVIKWLKAAKFERYTDFVKENESNE